MSHGSVADAVAAADTAVIIDEYTSLISVDDSNPAGAIDGDSNIKDESSVNNKEDDLSLWTIACILSTSFAYGCIMTTLFLITLPMECERIEKQHPTIPKSVRFGRNDDMPCSYTHLTHKFLLTYRWPWGVSWQLQVSLNSFHPWSECLVILTDRLSTFNWGSACPTYVLELSAASLACLVNTPTPMINYGCAMASFSSFT
jgi:hypothetical protein